MTMGTNPTEAAASAKGRAIAASRRRRELAGGIKQRLASTSIAEPLERYGLLLLTSIIVAFFALWPQTRDVYLNSANVRVTIGNQTVLGVAAIAAIPPLLCGRFDLSIGAVLGLAAIGVAAAMSRAGLPLVVAVGLGPAIGAMVGLANGVLTTRFRIHSLICTIGTATIIGGVVSWYTGGESIVSGISPGLIGFGTGEFLLLPQTVIVLAAVAVAAWFLFQHTPFGRYLHAIGSNEEASRLVGLRVEHMVVLSFVLAGAIAGVAGVLLVARSGGATPTAGPLYALPAFASAFLGAAAIRPGRFNVWGTMVAILFLASLTSGLNLAGAQDYVTDLVNGVALLVGVGLTAQFARRRAGR